MSSLYGTQIETAQWILSILDKKGPIKVDTGMNKHLFDPHDYLSDDFIIGQEGSKITIKDCNTFLRKLAKYAKSPEFNQGRTYFFEGIKKKGKSSYVFLWGS